MVDVQRLSLGEGVKPQANGGRKIDSKKVESFLLTNSLNFTGNRKRGLCDRDMGLHLYLKILPTVDMWTRQKWQDNIVINDPKGELLRKFYVPATVRGYEVLQFNLINPMKTDIFNPLGMAAEAARTGNSVKCAQYIENIATIFFPVDGGDDPVWANSANNAFKRICYGMIDYYLEEEKVLRYEARVRGWSDRLLMARLDSMWAKVTLYNCYQMFVQLSSKVEKNPGNVLNEKEKAGEVVTGEEKEYAAKKAEFFDGKPQMDLLSLYFAATERLPVNSIRTLAMNTHNALKSMGSAEKMLSSVFSISITAMVRVVA